jgi:hypothetical protein
MGDRRDAIQLPTSIGKLKGGLEMEPNAAVARFFDISRPDLISLPIQRKAIASWV